MTHLCRRGFTLTELIVIVFICAILVGLLLPLLSSSHCDGRRGQCQNNMKNVALGLLQYQTTHNCFPNAGTFLPTSGASPSEFTYDIPEQGLGWNWVVDILPYMDQSDLANAWDRSQPFNSTTSIRTGQPSNAVVSDRTIGILRCPDDRSAPADRGNLSYVVNGGFALDHRTGLSYFANAATEGETGGNVFLGFPGGAADLTRMGVMFLGTSAGNTPGDHLTKPADIVDGSCNTILLSENTLAGYDPGISNWACPLPQYCMFIGSPHICNPGALTASSTPIACGDSRFPLKAGQEWSGWAETNRWTLTNFDAINRGQNLTRKGTFPFSNSGHPRGCNMAFCDGGIRFIRESIDGTVYAKLITPNGGALSSPIRQLP